MNHYTYEELFVGLEEFFQVRITEEMLITFCSITEDQNPLHTNKEFAISAGYRDRVIYGMLTASFLSTLAGVYLPGEHSLIHIVETEFVKPVYIGDLLTIRGTVREKDDNFHVIWIKVVITNQDGMKVLRGKMRIGLTG